MVDWTDNYYALAFPGTVGGGPGAVDTLVLTVTVTGGDTSSNPVKAAADKAAYDAEDANDKERHKRFSDIVQNYMRHGIVVGIESDGDQTITLKYEQGSMFVDGTVGRPDWLNKVERANAFEIGAEYVADNDYNVTGIAVTINGASQSS
ncbi:hypothetical protein CL653_03510 [bacterium]|nr:hypothetical protein [bacterium]|tara:strand:- start:931 stop:1377 length:447 start_codon:yes stop_codon:yes gene_type:complete